MKALLALEDGRSFACQSFTGPGETCGEIVFNTSMTGYQEVLTDPSYGHMSRYHKCYGRSAFGEAVSEVY